MLIGYKSRVFRGCIQVEDSWCRQQGYLVGRGVGYKFILRDINIIRIQKEGKNCVRFLKLFIYFSSF